MKAVKPEDLSRVVEVRMIPCDRYDTPSMIADHLRRMYDEVMQHPRRDKVLATQTLCGVDIKVSAKSNLRDMEREARRALQGFIPPEVGPTPKMHPSKDDYINDKIIEAANKALEGALDLQLRVLDDWEEPFLASDELSVFDRAMLMHSTRLGRKFQLEMDKSGFDPDDEEAMVQVAVDTGLPMADFDNSCLLFRYSLERLMHDWIHRGVIASITDKCILGPSVADIVRQIRCGLSDPIEYIS